MERRLRVIVVACAGLGCGRIGIDRTEPDVEPSRCASSTALLCDGFEQGAFPGVRWTRREFGGRVEVDETRSHRGSRSLHSYIDAPAVNPVENLRAMVMTYDGMTSAPIGTLYLRTWAYFESIPEAHFNQVLNFSDDVGNGISLGMRNGKLIANDYTSQLYAESSVSLPLERWTCLVLVIPSGVAGTTRVILDDDELRDIELTKRTVQPAPTHLFYGNHVIPSGDVGQPFDAWFDELLLDDKQVQCSD